MQCRLKTTKGSTGRKLGIHTLWCFCGRRQNQLIEYTNYCTVKLLHGYAISCCALKRVTRTKRVTLLFSQQIKFVLRHNVHVYTILKLCRTG